MNHGSDLRDILLDGIYHLIVLKVEGIWLSGDTSLDCAHWYRMFWPAS